MRPMRRRAGPTPGPRYRETPGTSTPTTGPPSTRLRRNTPARREAALGRGGLARAARRRCGGGRVPAAVGATAIASAGAGVPSRHRASTVAYAPASNRSRITARRSFPLVVRGNAARAAAAPVRRRGPVPRPPGPRPGRAHHLRGRPRRPAPPHEDDDPLRRRSPDRWSRRPRPDRSAARVWRPPTSSRSAAWNVRPLTNTTSL